MKEGSTTSRVNNSLNEYMLCYQFGFFVHKSIPLSPQFLSLHFALASAWSWQILLCNVVDFKCIVRKVNTWESWTGTGRFQLHSGQFSLPGKGDPWWRRKHHRSSKVVLLISTLLWGVCGVIDWPCKYNPPFSLWFSIKLGFLGSSISGVVPNES